MTTTDRITDENNSNRHNGNDGVADLATGRVRRRRKPATIQRATATPTPTPLDLVEDKLRAHVVFPSEHEPVAVTLWIAATHAQPAWDHATRMVIRSPIKRCGKSRLLDLVYGLAHQVMMTANVSVAALVHSIDADEPPTILMDEADTTFGRGQKTEFNEPLRGLLNAGFQRNRPYIRWDPVKRQREESPTFAMAALAGIGRLPDTIEDRAVIVNLRRRRRDETVQPFRVRDVPSLEPLRDKLGDWVRDRLPVLKGATPTLSLEDRDADVWEPLIAIADQAGGTWPERARATANALTQGAEEDEAELLLQHIYEAFHQSDGTRRMASRDLVEALFDREDGPWAAMWKQDVSRKQNESGVWVDDYRVVGVKLAAMLKPFGIEGRKVKVPGMVKPLQGYRVEDFTDTWSRLGIGDGTNRTQGTTQVRLLRDGTDDGTATEPEETGSIKVPSKVLTHNAPTREDPSVPSVPTPMPRRRVPPKRRRTT